MNFLNWRNFSLKSRFIAFDGILRDPFDSQIVLRYRFNALPVSDQCSNGFAAITDLVFCQNRLILDVGVDAETVVAGNILPGQDSHQSRIFFNDFFGGGQNKCGTRVRRADHTHPQRIVRRRVGTVDFSTQQFWLSIHFPGSRSKPGIGIRRKFLGFGS